MRARPSPPGCALAQEPALAYDLGDREPLQRTLVSNRPLSLHSGDEQQPTSRPASTPGLGPEPGLARRRCRGLVVIILIALVLGAGGCARVKEDAKRIALENTLNSYRQAIRWGQFSAAAGFLSPEQRLDLDSERLANLRVTGYEVLQPGLIGPDDTAVQLVQIDYVLEDRQRLERLRDRQRWRHDADSRAWWLESGLPAFVD